MKQTSKTLFAILAIAMFTTFVVNKSEAQVIDYDGNTYKTVTIGTQEWTSENLNVEHYRNGDLIPQVQDPIEWSKLTTGAWCYYNNDPKNGKKYGKLYNWYAVSDPRGLAPEGWHVPSDAEWTKLTDFLGGNIIEVKLEDGTKYWLIESVGGKLKSVTLWNSPNEGATNSCGFTAFPGGIRTGGGWIDDIGKNGFFCSASEVNDGDAWFRALIYDYSGVLRGFGSKLDGLSCRCVRD